MVTGQEIRFAERREIEKRSGFAFTVVPEFEERKKRGVCPVCEKPKEEWPRKHTGYCCTKECRAAYLERTVFWWEDYRYRAARAADYKCARCGIDCRDPKYAWNYIGTVDHIVPIALGGDEFDLANLQLLCKACDRKKTKDDMATIAAVRREIKRIQPGQTILGLDSGEP